MKEVKSKNKSSLDFDLVVVNWERPLLPDQNDEYRSIIGKDGQVHFSGDMDNIEVRVQFFKQNATIASWLRDRRNIVSWLHSQDEIEYRFDDEPDVYYIGKVTSTDIPENYKPAVSFWVTFTFQPFSYGSSIQEEFEDTSSPLLINNSSNYMTPYVATMSITSSVTSLSFELNGVSIIYDESLGSGDVVTIDLHEMELRVNDELKVIEVEGFFEYLQGGTNELKVSAPAYVEIGYVERFL